MLEPAILYSETLYQKSFSLMKEPERYFYYSGKRKFEPIDISDENGSEEQTEYHWAIVDKGRRVIGYIGYTIDWYCSFAYNFDLVSFSKDKDKDNNFAVIAAAIKEVLKMIKENNIHRIEFWAVGGNPIIKHYNSFCKKNNGRILILKNRLRDGQGKFHDDYCYEIFLK